MQRTTGFEQLTDTELIRAAQYGDTWAREQLIGAYQPLVHALAARSLDARPGAEDAVYAIVRDTLSRAEFALGTLSSPDDFRPWLVGIGVASTLAHAATLPVEAAPAGGFAGALRWLDIEDAVLVALGSLEQEGALGRDETAAALNWSPQDVALRLETVRVRLDAARSVSTALARVPRCAVLDEHAATWDGHPGAAWRDELARHTAQCGHCATGFTPAAADSTRPGYAAAASVAVGGAGWAVSAPGRFGTADGADVADVAGMNGVAYMADTAGVAQSEALAPTETFAAVLSDATATATGTGTGTGHPTPAGQGGATVAAAGRHGTRAARRRRRQTDERNRRRAVVAAGLAVVAVTGGAFTLNAGRGGDEDLLEANRASAPDLDLRLTNEPGTQTTSPSTASPTRTPGAKPTSTPSKTPRPTATTPAPKRPATAAPTTAPPAPSKTTPARGSHASQGGSRQDSGQSSTADQVIALVNAERAKVGCGALTANATLTKAAQGHSDDMAARDFFDHTNPDGAGPGDRVTAAGYPWSTYGENIAMGQSTPEQVMESWMNSPGHRANILNCDFKEIGVGVHNSGGPYWTQVFGAR